MRKILIADILRKVVTQLVAGEYAALYGADQSKEILPEEIELAITDYPGELTYPPDEAFTSFVDYGTAQSLENQIEFTLWYNNEPSDLTLSMTVYEPNLYGISDIRVL